MLLARVGAPWKSVARVRRGIGLRLLVGVVLFSSAITLVLTALELYLDYSHDVGVIERRLDDIEQASLRAIGESLWHLDEAQLRVQLEGILRLPDIRAIEVRETTSANPLVLSFGERQSYAVLVRDLPVVYGEGSAARPIGTLHVEATLTEVYRTLRDRVVVILVSQGAKTFLVSFFLIFLFHRLVTRHLVSIADYLRDYDFRVPAPRLRLQRRAPSEPDELDRTVTAFNELFADLQIAYDELRQKNVELERDIAARRQVEAALRTSEERFRDYAEIASDWFWETGPDHRFTYISERVADFGFNAANLLGRPRWDAATDREEEPEKWRRHFETLDHHEPFRGFAYKIAHADGSPAIVESSGKPVFDASGQFAGYRGGGRDVTAQYEIEAQLQQAQKIVAVGQLTGGLAHDFNNLLTVIIGSVDLALNGPQPVARGVLENALKAAQRGAVLVHRLLAFSRRQALKPEALDLNKLVAGMEEMLRRTLGGNIEFEMRLAPAPCLAAADKGQVENALLNLAINARDAMSQGGRLIIETAIRYLDAAYAAQSGELAPGDYAMLAVSDTGTGMSPEVLERAIEPFFTTKDVGKGSGLGLSMIFGFAKQSGGHLQIESELGRGTRVKLYLPRSAESVAPALHPPAPADHPRGGEAILLVEDDADVRRFVAAQLEGLGYRVLEAPNGPAAEAILDGDAAIDLLLTDIMMPGGMTGTQLAETARRLRPGLKVLLTSGHGGAQREQRDPNVPFLAKPYLRQDLALKVREVLDASP